MRGNCHTTILLVDDKATLKILGQVLSRKGYSNVMPLSDSRLVPQFLESHEISVIVLDLMMPKVSGQSLLKLLAAKYPALPVIVLNAENKLETAIDCMKEGACDYLLKPLDLRKFQASLERALELNSMHNANFRKTQSSEPSSTGKCCFANIITRDETMRGLLDYVRMIAPYRMPVLIQGETGVGKELFVRALHQASGRTGPLIPVNVAGLDDNTFSDTLFGHKKGTYTGALTDRAGLVSTAAHGTLFLDEIGDLAESAQIRLLRLLQENEYYCLGYDTPVKCEARIVVATNRDLKEAMTKGTFRKDLYYRLFTHRIEIPPLRSRQNDIPLLLESFVAAAARTLGKSVPSYPPELIALLSSYPFPGNLRQLQAMVCEAVVKCVSQTLEPELFQEMMTREGDEAQCTVETEPADSCFAPIWNSAFNFPTLRETEEVLIQKALDIARSNQSVAASMLGISRQALNRRLKGRPSL